MKQLLGVMLLLSLFLTGCGSSNDKPASMEDLEAYIKSKDKTYKKFDMSEFADVKKAREDLEKSGIVKFAQFDSESGIGPANIYKYKNEKLATKHSQKTKENIYLYFGAKKVKVYSKAPVQTSKRNSVILKTS